MVQVLAKAIGPHGMALGQAEDLAAEGRAIGLQELALLHRHKTGALFSACIEMGILASPKEITPELAGKLLRYGQHLGLAFSNSR